MEWIRTTERLPEHNKPVLTFDSFYGYQVANHLSGIGWVYLIAQNRKPENIVYWAEIIPPPAM